jgi:hypothetical protein
MECVECESKHMIEQLKDIRAIPKLCMCIKHLAAVSKEYYPQLNPSVMGFNK